MGGSGGLLSRLSAWLNAKAAAADTEAARRTEAKRAALSKAFGEEVARVFRWPEHDDVLSVVGESHYQGELKSIAGEHGERSASKTVVALLRPEADNPHDDKAVSIWIEGLKVGHLSSDDARSFRRRLSSKKLSNQTTACTALVVGGYKMQSGERASYGVQLCLKPFW